jgi:hypothetical protein
MILAQMIVVSAEPFSFFSPHPSGTEVDAP